MRTISIAAVRALLGDSARPASLRTPSSLVRRQAPYAHLGRRPRRARLSARNRIAVEHLDFLRLACLMSADSPAVVLVRREGPGPLRPDARRITPSCLRSASPIRPLSTSLSVELPAASACSGARTRRHEQRCLRYQDPRRPSGAQSPAPVPCEVLLDLRGLIPSL